MTLDMEVTFLIQQQKSQSLKEITDKLDFTKIKTLCSVKVNVKRMRRQATDWEKMFAKEHMIKDCSPKYTENS